VKKLLKKAIHHSDYVLELEKKFEDHGGFKKDKEAIRLTIEKSNLMSGLINFSISLRYL